MPDGLKSVYGRINRVFPNAGALLRRVLLGEHKEGYRGKITGQGNLIQAEGASLENVELDIVGERNRIQVGAGSVLKNLKIRMRGSGHLLEFGKDCRVSRGGSFWFEDENCSLQVGQGTSMVDVHIAVTEPGSRVTIGAECMLANDIDIRTGDSHSIIDAATQERLNFAEDVIISDHVWIGAHSVILKGVHLGPDCVVATGAIVTQSCPGSAILAGNPARVIKTGVSWKRERLKKEKRE